MSIRYDMIHERDKRTDRQTDGHRMTAIAALMHYIVQQQFTYATPLLKSQLLGKIILICVRFLIKNITNYKFYA